MLRKLYPTSVWDDIHQALPHRGKTAIIKKANLHGLSRPMRTFALSGNHIIDGIKWRARELKITLRDLDAEAQTCVYFSGTSHKGFVSIRAIERALKVLGGRLEIVWDD